MRFEISSLKVPVQQVASNAKSKIGLQFFCSPIFDRKFRGLCLSLAAGVRKNEFLMLNSEFPQTNLTTLIHYLFPLNWQLLLLLLLLFLL